MNKIRTIVHNWKAYWGELKNKRNEEGLTLIELMVVVVILGIIAAIAIPAISSAINSAKVSSTESDLATIQEALQRYYIDHNNYPSGLTNLSELTSANGQPSTGTGAFGPYLDVHFPEKDSFGNNIGYQQVNSGTGYYLVSSDGHSWSSNWNSTLATATLPSGTIIIAAGGLDSSNTSIAQTPNIDTSPTQSGSFTNN